MRIKITLVDENNGHVRIDCQPPIPKLIQAYKDGDMTPALMYAVLAIKKMQGDSEQIEKEQEKERKESALRNGLILPWKEKKEEGPQEIYQ